MPTSALATLILYAASSAVLAAAVQIRAEIPDRPIRPIDRVRERGEIIPGIPRLDPEDPMANAAALMAAIGEVGYPGLDVGLERRCDASARQVVLALSGRVSSVRFSGRNVCQLEQLKRISAAQPGFGRRGLAEVAAFLLGRRLGDGPAVDVTRIVVPPFHFTHDTVTFLDADLGPLEPGERLIGTYHTHPGGDLEEGVLSPIDLRFFEEGRVDFHGQIGALRHADAGLDWLLHIVEPRDGDWNVFAHDADRFRALSKRCDNDESCPVDELRIAGSANYLLTRYYKSDR